jgi:hypothetical protein
MRFMACTAFASVCVDCAERALGNVPQHIVTTDFLWVYWVLAAVWAVSGIGVAVRGVP